MKRLISALAALALIFALSACTGREAPDNAPVPKQEAAVRGEAQESTEESVKRAEYKLITAEEAKAIIDNEKDYIILDVRTDEEYSERHIPGAVLIPDYELESRAPAELPDKAQQILVYCRTGRRSAAAAKKLVEMGYTNVKDFGGINSWSYETTTE